MPATADHTDGVNGLTIRKRRIAIEIGDGEGCLIKSQRIAVDLFLLSWSHRNRTRLHQQITASKGDVIVAFSKAISSSRRAGHRTRDIDFIGVKRRVSSRGSIDTSCRRNGHVCNDLTIGKRAVESVSLIDNAENSVIECDPIPVELLLSTRNEFDLTLINREVGSAKGDVVVTLVETVRTIVIIESIGVDADVIRISLNIRISARCNPSGTHKIDSIDLLAIRKSCIPSISQPIIKNREGCRSKWEGVTILLRLPRRSQGNGACIDNKVTIYKVQAVIINVEAITSDNSIDLKFIGISRDALCGACCHIDRKDTLKRNGIDHL